MGEIAPWWYNTTPIPIFRGRFSFSILVSGIVLDIKWLLACLIPVKWQTQITPRIVTINAFAQWKLLLGPADLIQQLFHCHVVPLFCKGCLPWSITGNLH